MLTLIQDIILYLHLLRNSDWTVDMAQLTTHVAPPGKHLQQKGIVVAWSVRL